MTGSDHMPFYYIEMNSFILVKWARVDDENMFSFLKAMICRKWDWIGVT